MDVPIGLAGVSAAWSRLPMFADRERPLTRLCRAAAAIWLAVLTVTLFGCAESRPVRQSGRQPAVTEPEAQHPVTSEPNESTNGPGVAPGTKKAEPPAPPPVQPSTAKETEAAEASAQARHGEKSAKSATAANETPSTDSPSNPMDNAWKSAPAATGNLAKVREIVDGCLAFLEQNPKYTVRVSRQEKVGNRVLSPETMLMHFRLHPRSVYYKWLDETNAGRAVLYVEGQNEGMIISHGGKGDFLLAGRTLRVDPNGFLARSKSRYSITESGLDNMTRRLEIVVALLERGDQSRGTVEYLGESKQQGIAGPLLVVRQHIPPGADPFVPKGGIRHWYFEASTQRLVIMHGDELGGSFFEHYVFDRFVPNPALTDRDFDPDLVFPGKKAADSGWRTPASKEHAGDETVAPEAKSSPTTQTARRSNEAVPR